MILTLVLKKDLTTRNSHMKYESSITYGSKVITNVTVFCEQTDKQTVQELYMPLIYRYRDIKVLLYSKISLIQGPKGMTRLFDLSQCSKYPRWK